MTRNGIEYNLNISPYFCIKNDVKFVFSSQTHLNKFKENIYKNRDNMRESLSRRYGISSNINLLADIVLYKKIETRGFLIISEGVSYTCQKQIILDGQLKVGRLSAEK